MRTHIAVYVAPVIRDRQILSWRFEVLRDGVLLASGGDRGQTYPDPGAAREMGWRCAKIYG